MAKTRVAEFAALWVDDAGCLHVSLRGTDGKEFASIAFDEDTSIDIVVDLAGDMDELYVADDDGPDDVQDPDDPIGKTVGNA